MKRKYIIAASVLAVAVITCLLCLALRPKRGEVVSVTYPQLAKDEQRMYKLVREIPGSSIIGESLARERSDSGDLRVVVTFMLDGSKGTMQSMSYNLTSLAKKQQQLGTTDEEFKASLKQ